MSYITLFTTPCLGKNCLIAYTTKIAMHNGGVNSGLTSHQQRGHTETGARFKVSSERPKKRGIDLAIPELVIERVIHCTTAVPILAFTVIKS